MLLAGLQRSFSGSASGHVVRQRVLAAGLLAGAVSAAVWAPRARAEELLEVPGEAGAVPNKLPPVAARPAKPADDGLDAVRQRMREYGCRPVEEKLISLLRELRQDEAKQLKRFAEAEAEGDEGMMRTFHSIWKQTAGRMELLQADPSKFVQQHGYLYDIDE